MPGPASLYLLIHALDDLIATGGVLDGAIAHLYSNNYTPLRTSLLSNFTESAWAGYAHQALTWNAPVLTSGDQPGFSDSNPVLFGPNTSGGSVNVYGYYLTDAAGTDYLGGELFSSGPIAIANGLPFQLIVTVQDISEF